MTTTTESPMDVPSYESGAGAVGREDPSGIHQAHSRINASTHGLIELVGMLEDRLAPVLRPERPLSSLTGTLKSDPASESPMSEELHRSADLVAGASDRLSALLQRIDL